MQVEVPPIPDCAKNLTVAQLLARMMATNNTWAEAVRTQSELHSTHSDVTIQEPYAVMPTQNSQVGEQNEDGSANPQEEH
ncbi:alpha-amylase [Sesbania bispinosa]|nr:alpha-amylase [Sesbania bispinosa]